MNNFINVNATTYNKSSLSANYEHNVERKKNGEDIDYLLEESDKLGANQIQTFGYSAVSSGTYAENLRNSSAQSISKNNDYSTFKANFDYLENERLKQLKEEKRSDYQKKHLVEFVVSLSEEMAKEYIDKGVDINKGFKAYSNALKDTYNCNVLNLSIHMDEGYCDKDNKIHFNFHCHIVAHNYNFENKKAILSNFSKKDFRNLQTLAQKTFQDTGLDFKKGVSKFKTKKEHLMRNDHILQKQAKELKGLKQDLEQKNRENKEIYTLLNSQKNELKTLRTQFEKDTNMYKILSVNIKNLTQNEQEKRSEYRELDLKLKDLQKKTQKEEIKIDNIEKYGKEIKQDLKEYLLQNTTKKDNKYYINDMNNFYTSLVDTFNNISNFDLKIEELEKLQNTNEILKKHLEKINLENENLKVQLGKIDTLNVKIKELISKKDLLEEENYNLKIYLKDKNLEEDYTNYTRKQELNQDFER